MEWTKDEWGTHRLETKSNIYEINKAPSGKGGWLISRYNKKQKAYIYGTTKKLTLKWAKECVERYYVKEFDLH